MNFLILIIIPIVVGLYAQMRIKSAYNRNLKRQSRGRITGREAAMAVMQSAGINDVEIVECRGELTDHYDPTHKRLALSAQNYRGSSLAASRRCCSRRQDTLYNTNKNMPRSI